MMDSEYGTKINVLVRKPGGKVVRESRELTAEDARNYAALREVLDMFERRMVEYFFAGATAKERESRADAIRKLIGAFPVTKAGRVDKTWALNLYLCEVDTDCPLTLPCCVYGVCVQCP
jgi:hypothetical protein